MCDENIVRRRAQIEQNPKHDTQLFVPLPSS